MKYFMFYIVIPVLVGFSGGCFAYSFLVWLTAGTDRAIYRLLLKTRQRQARLIRRALRTSAERWKKK